MAFRAVFLSLLVMVTVAASAGGQSLGRVECDGYSLDHSTLPNGRPFDGHRAMALFRFHRQKEALREVDAGRAIARGPWRWRLPPDQRDEYLSAIDALLKCLAEMKPPGLATLTVRVRGYPRNGGNTFAPQAGARVAVEGLPVGLTGNDGTLTVPVPSGHIEVWAAIPLNQASFDNFELAPGESRSVEITLSDGKEVHEPSTLVLAEAVDDILPLTTPSMTLKFIQDGRLAPVTGIDQIDVEDANGDFRGSITEHFTIVDGQIVATNASRVFAELAPLFGQNIVLQVHAMSRRNAHHGEIAFRLGQWPLRITLEPPPSNRALSVSNIDVGISLVGAGIAVQRTSDPKGRLGVESFPAGTVALECVAVSGGTYYYGQATLVHSGPRSVTLVLRAVEDVRNGIPPLRSDPPAAKDDVPLARTIDPPPPREEGISRILVESSERNRPIAVSTTLTVRRGTERLMVAYIVKTLETRRDPGFDDLWTLSLFDGNGRNLLQMIRNVGSQNSVHPHWQSTGGTGRIQEIFDITTHAAQGDVRLTLVATATNIGDDRDPTTVEALITAIDKGWGPTRVVK